MKVILKTRLLVLATVVAIVALAIHSSTKGDGQAGSAQDPPSAKDQNRPGRLRFDTNTWQVYAADGNNAGLAYANTPELLALRKAAAQAVLDPINTTQQRMARLTPDQRKAIDEAVAAIIQPELNYARVQATKSPEELAAESRSLRAILGTAKP